MKSLICIRMRPKSSVLAWNIFYIISVVLFSNEKKRRFSTHDQHCRPLYSSVFCGMFCADGVLVSGSRRGVKSMLKDVEGHNIFR
ncbi:hypothetical protein BDZ45DRAFT_181425 [Acephala macrosclerotiorum]|nr:hypothetical protein BDZ45DRAFT_181425 [Acephala macrosclerotiorum]